MENKNKKSGISFALAGGGARSCIYIGFFEVLEENNIPVDCIAGTSMGAIVGGAIALGLETKQIRDIALEFSKKSITGWRNFNFFNESIFKADPLENLTERFFGNHTFEDLKIPFACNAVNLETGKEVVFTKGLLKDATRSSAAYPVVFPPKFIDEKYCVDGGVINNVPAMLARKIGAEKLVVISPKNNCVRQHISGLIFHKHLKHKYEPVVHKSFHLTWPKKFSFKKHDIKFTFEILLECIQIASKEHIKRDIEKAKPDLIIRPSVNIGIMEFTKVDKAIEIGREMAKKHLPEIKKLLDTNDSNIETKAENHSILVCQH